jgi:hypothetical protein
MGEFRDVVDTLGDVKANFAEVGLYATKRSISSAAMEGTADFPVLVDDSLNLDDCVLIARSLEKKYASFLLTVLTMDPYLEVEKGSDPSAAAYLRKFHQNTRVKPADNGVALNLVDFLKEGYEVNGMDYSVMECEAFKMAHVIYEGVTRSLPQDRHVLLNYSIDEIVTEGTLNDRTGRGLPLFEADDKTPRNIKNVRFNGGDDNTYNFNGEVGRMIFNDGSTVNNPTSNATVEKGAATATNTNTYKKGSFSPNADSTSNATIQKGAVNINVKTGNSRGAQWKPLTDNDCKKANDLVPTLLHIRVYPIDKTTREELTPIDFLMGVKATVHPIPLSEISRMVVAGMRNENFAFNFIRWRTGEIKFFKDFVFAIDSMKMDAKDSGKDVTGWRPALKRRKRLSKSPVRLTKKSVMPNTTLVMTQSGIDYIKESYGYDLNNEAIMNRMMSTYFLLGFVVTNSVTQVAKFKFDGIDTTDTYTFDTLKRENTSDDKAFKNMMKMLGRSM